MAHALLCADGENATLLATLQARGVAAPEETLADAHEIGILLTDAELEEMERFYGPWIWGPVTAALMFGYHTQAFADGETEQRLLSRRSTLEAGVQAMPDDALIALPKPAPDMLTSVLKRRRSIREFGPAPVDLEPLAACLRAGCGITGEHSVDNGRLLTLTAAPSPGGLNTHDAYVISREVDGLERGTYRYLPREDALVRTGGRSVPFDGLFGGQGWARDASCAVVLVADLERQAIRYTFPTSVAAVLLETGARLELLLLEAEERSLAAVTLGLAGVGAFDLELAKAAGVWGPTSMQVPICAVLLGSRRAPTSIRA